MSSAVIFISYETRTCDFIFSISNTNSLLNYKWKNLAIVDSFTKKGNYNEHFILTESNKYLALITFWSEKRGKVTILHHF